ncbi:NAD(P)-binding protein, partial [Aureobasidium melanogenum]
METETSAQSELKEYLMKDPEYARLAELQAKGWQNPAGDTFFEKRRQQSINADERSQKILFDMMGRIGEETNASTVAFSLSNAMPAVLDLCVAPGGFVKYVLQINPFARVDAFCLLEQQGGHKMRIPFGRSDPRVSVAFQDVTLFADEFGLPDIFKDPKNESNLALRWPYTTDRYDMVICDGQVPRQNRVEDDYFEPLRLTYSQLFLGLKRVASGGTMIVLLHRSGRVRIFRLLRMFCQFSQVQIFKPAKAHAIKSSFYLVANNIQPDNPACIAAMNLFKLIWQRATVKDESAASALLYKDLGQVEKSLQPELEDFGERFVELVRPTWKIQADALKKAPFTKDPATARPICEHYFRGKCAYGNSCFKSHELPAREI